MSDTNAKIVSFDADEILAHGRDPIIVTCTLGIRLDDGLLVSINSYPFAAVRLGQRVRIDIDLRMGDVE